MDLKATKEKYDEANRAVEIAEAEFRAAQNQDYERQLGEIQKLYEAGNITDGFLRDRLRLGAEARARISGRDLTDVMMS